MLLQVIYACTTTLRNQLTGMKEKSSIFFLTHNPPPLTPFSTIHSPLPPVSTTVIIQASYNNQPYNHNNHYLLQPNSPINNNSHVQNTEFSEAVCLNVKNLWNVNKCVFVRLSRDRSTNAEICMLMQDILL